MAAHISDRDWQNDFDLDDPTYGDVFHEVADELVAKCPVAHSKDGYYVVSRYDDIIKMLHDWETFSSADGIIGAVRAPGQPLFKPNESDPPEHTQLRKALQGYFTAGAVSKHEQRVREIANGLIDRFIDKGEVDVVTQYADALPPISFCRVVANMPAEDMDFLQRVFTDALIGPLETRGINWVKGQDYCAEFLKRRKMEPRQNDIVDALLQFSFSDGRPYTDEDRAGSLAQIVAAGATTTGAVISGSLYHLASHPEELAKLQANRALIPTAIEEFLRVFVSAPNNGRRVMKDVEIGGVKLSGPKGDEKGDYVIYNLGGANRDPSVFKCPEKIDLQRKPNPHISFAKGLHTCLGIHLARLNLRVAINVFLERIPEFVLPEGYQPHFLGGITRSITHLPLTFTPRA